jgi:hypothetical protein
MITNSFWNYSATTPRSPSKFIRRFGGTCRLLLQRCRVSKKQSFAYCLLHAGFLLGLFFDPEDRLNIFFRNAGCPLTKWHCIPKTELSITVTVRTLNPTDVHFLYKSE